MSAHETSTTPILPIGASFSSEKLVSEVQPVDLRRSLARFLDVRPRCRNASDSRQGRCPRNRNRLGYCRIRPRGVDLLLNGRWWGAVPPSPRLVSGVLWASDWVGHQSTG